MRAHEIAYNYLKTRILDGTLRPAQRLIETQLVESIGVSRNTIKKALMQLAKEGLVVVEENKGATIRSLKLEEILECYEIRIALEGLLVGHIVANMTKDKELTLSTMLLGMEKAAEEKNFDLYSDLNRQFHSVIYEVSGKTIITELIQRLKSQLGRLHVKTLLAPQRSEKSLEEHQAILEAIKERDELKLGKTIRLHLENVVDTIMEYRDLFF